MSNFFEHSFSWKILDGIIGIVMWSIAFLLFITVKSYERKTNKTKIAKLTGVFWMIITGICFLGVTALVKFMGTRIPAAESAFLRYALGLVLLLPMLKDFSQNLPNRKLSILFAARGLFIQLEWCFGFLLCQEFH